MSLLRANTVSFCGPLRKKTAHPVRVARAIEVIHAVGKNAIFVGKTTSRLWCLLIFSNTWEKLDACYDRGSTVLANHCIYDISALGGRLLNRATA